MLTWRAMSLAFRVGGLLTSIGCGPRSQPDGNGRIVLADTAANLMKNTEVKRIYLGT